jgi:hypothetical protein
MLWTYRNHPDLLEQVREAVVIMAEGRRNRRRHARATAQASSTRSRCLRDRFTSEDLQTMVDHFVSGTTAQCIADKYGLSVRSVRRLLRERGINREHRK